MKILHVLLVLLLLVSILTLGATAWFGYRTLREIAALRREKADLTASTREIQRGAARYAELLVRAEGRLSQCQAY